MLLLGLGTLTVQAQKDGDFRSWDTDRDGSINDIEFSTAWDGNDYHADWDIDSDGFIDEREWRKGTDRYYKDVDGWGENRNRDFTSWDMDDDNRLDQDEFRQGSYNTWDTDMDGRINSTEYRNYNTFNRM